jgi:ribosomal protein S18 acetylase RimI-like enzyme
MTVMGVLLAMRHSTVYSVRDGGEIVGTFALSTHRPWSIDASFFTPGKRPVYLTSMAVAPDRQRQGLGSFCISEATRLVREWPGDAIRLDAWDADAGAGEFYRKCGLREVGRNTYKGAKLIYFELLV